MIDYLRDPSTGDLMISNGDFVRGESTMQHQNCLLLAEPGAYKQFPNVGVGIMTYLKDDNQADLLRAIRQQFISDGMSVNALSYNAGKLKINASYAG
jgi:hypothetical protein